MEVTQLTDTQEVLVNALNETLPKFKYLAARLSRTGEDSEDLMQDSYVAVLTAIRNGTVDSVERIGPYLHGTMKYLVTNKWERAGVVRKYEGQVLEHFYARRKPMTAEEMLFSAQQKKRANSLLNLLSKPQRDVMSASLSGKTKEETIRLLGITPTQYRLTKSRAKQRLMQLCTEAVGS